MENHEKPEVDEKNDTVFKFHELHNIEECDESEELKEDFQHVEANQSVQMPCRPRRKTATETLKKMKSVDRPIHKVSKRRLHSRLETIFEEPFANNCHFKVMGTGKIKRSISFSEFATKTKLKWRKAQVKKLKTIKESQKTMNDVEVQMWNLDL